MGASEDPQPPSQDRFRSQRGQTMVVFVIFLPVVFALLSFVVDLGSAWVKKREVQNAADAAALAAAWCAAKPSATGCSAGYVAVGNNYVTDKNGLSGASVEVNRPPTSGSHTTDTRYVEVKVTAGAGLFMPSRSVPVHARAVAAAIPPAPEMNLFAFAMSTNCNPDNSFSIRGSRNVFHGALWSNGGFGAPGGNNVADELTIGPGCTPSGLSDDSFPTPKTGRTTEWPVPPPPLLTVDGVQNCIAGGKKASTSSPTQAWKAANPPGVYCRDDQFTLSSTFLGYTWVAPKTIVQGSSPSLSPASTQPEQIVLYATGTQSDAISVSASNFHFTGGLVAPNGGINFNGSGTTTGEGFMEAQTIAIPGANTTFTGTAPNPTPQDPVISLVE